MLTCSIPAGAIYVADSCFLQSAVLANGLVLVAALLGTRFVLAMPYNNGKKASDYSNKHNSLLLLVLSASVVGRRKLVSAAHGTGMGCEAGPNHTQCHDC